MQGRQIIGSPEIIGWIYLSPGCFSAGRVRGIRAATPSALDFTLWCAAHSRRRLSMSSLPSRLMWSTSVPIETHRTPSMICSHWLLALRLTTALRLCQSRGSRSRRAVPCHGMCALPYLPVLPLLLLPALLLGLGPGLVPRPDRRWSAGVAVLGFLPAIACLHVSRGHVSRGHVSMAMYLGASAGSCCVRAPRCMWRCLDVSRLHGAPSWSKAQQPCWG